MSISWKALRLTLLAFMFVFHSVSVQASSELVLLVNGQILAATGHVYEGDSVVLQLSNGGEMVFDRSLILGIEPDASAAAEGAGSGPETTLEHYPYADIITAVSLQNGVDPGLVAAIIEVESGFEAAARSPMGAMGLMQLMPETAVRYSLVNPYDPAANIEAGTKHLALLLGRYDIDSALAAYNAGEGAVQKFGGVPPYPETMHFISKVRMLVATGSN